MAKFPRFVALPVAAVMIVAALPRRQRRRAPAPRGIRCAVRRHRRHDHRHVPLGRRRAGRVPESP